MCCYDEAADIRRFPAFDEWVRASFRQKPSQSATLHNVGQAQMKNQYADPDDDGIEKSGSSSMSTIPMCLRRSPAPCRPRSIGCSTSALRLAEDARRPLSQRPAPAVPRRPARRAAASQFPKQLPHSACCCCVDGWPAADARLRRLLGAMDDGHAC